nr:hypothetical protein [Peristeroidobacter agariperforans]
MKQWAPTPPLRSIVFLAKLVMTSFAGFPKRLRLRLDRRGVIARGGLHKFCDLLAEGHLPRLELSRLLPDLRLRRGLDVRFRAGAGRKPAVLLFAQIIDLSRVLANQWQRWWGFLELIVDALEGRADIAQGGLAPLDDRLRIKILVGNDGHGRSGKADTGKQLEDALRIHDG